MDVMRKLQIRRVRWRLPTSLEDSNRILAVTEGEAKFRVRKTEIADVRELAVQPRMTIDTYLRIIAVRPRTGFMCRVAFDTTLFASQRKFGMFLYQMNSGTPVTTGTCFVGHRLERPLMAGGTSAGDKCVTRSQLAGTEHSCWRHRKTGLPFLKAGGSTGEQWENEKSEKDDTCQPESHGSLAKAPGGARTRTHRLDGGCLWLVTQFDFECQVDPVIRLDDPQAVRTNVERRAGNQWGRQLHMVVNDQDGVRLADNFHPVIRGPSYRRMPKLDSVIRQMNQAPSAPPDFYRFARNAAFLARQQPLVAARSLYEQAVDHRLPINEDGGDVRQ